MTYLATPQHNNPCPGGHEIYNFGRPLHGHYYYALSLSEPCLRVDKRFGDVTITGEGLQTLTFTRHSWPLRSESSFTCHNYCGSGQHLIMVISVDQLHSHLATHLNNKARGISFIKKGRHFRWNPKSGESRKPLATTKTSSTWNKPMGASTSVQGNCLPNMALKPSENSHLNMEQP